MVSRTDTALVGISLLLISSGCGSNIKPIEDAAGLAPKANVSVALTPSSFASRASSSPALSGAIAGDQGSVQITLVEAGQELRSPLRLTFANETVALTIEMETPAKIKMKGSPLPSSALPRQRLILKFKITERISEEEILVEYMLTESKAMEDPSVAAAVASVIDKAVALQVDQKGSSIVTNPGFNHVGTVGCPSL